MSRPVSSVRHASRGVAQSVPKVRHASRGVAHPAPAANGWRVAQPRRLRRATDDGMTLVEVLVAMSILTVVMAVSATVITFFYSQQNSISRSSSGFTEVIPTTTTLQAFFRSMVEPAPQAVVDAVLVPVPPFQPAPGSSSSGPFALGPFSATFTANVGDPNGPALFTITTTPNTAPYPSGVGPGTFTFTMTEARAVAGTCPFQPDSANPTYCQWDTANPKTVVSLDDVVNGPGSAAGTANPILQYTWGANTSPTPYSTAAGSPWQTDFGANSCTSITTCPADQITRVDINLTVQKLHGLQSGYATSVTPIAISYSEVVG